MVVHYAGAPVDLDPIMAIGEPVIEDAAHAVVSDVPDGKACGSKGEVGIYSYDAVKNLACPEGGGLTGSKAICQRARDLRYCGVGKSGFASTQEDRWWEPPVNGIFPKVLCNDVCAGIALEQLRRLPQLQARRNQIWDFYQTKLFFVRRPSDNKVHSRFTYLVRCKNRDKLAHYLKDNGVYSTLRYAPLHRLALYGQQDKVLPNTERLSEEGLNIPLHPGMTLEDAQKVVDLIHAFYS
jgi:aminotransferase